MEHTRHSSAFVWAAVALPLLAAACQGEATTGGSSAGPSVGAAGASALPAVTPGATTGTLPPTAASTGTTGTTPTTPTQPIGQTGTAITPPAGAMTVPTTPTTPVTPTTPTTPPATMTPAMTAPGAAPVSPYTLYDPATKDLKVPAPDQGVQVATSMFSLPPGAEKFTCYHGELPKDGEIDVKYWESVMAPGSHHFILYKTDNDPVPTGTMDQNGCTTGFQNWIYSSAQPHIDLQIPEGVAMVLGANQRVSFDMHYINTGDEALQVQVKLNAIFATGKFEKAASLISYNTGIFLQPHAAGTASGDCTPGNGAKFFYMLTHTHRRGKLATISRTLANGMMGETIVKSTDWEVPQEKKWLTDPFETFQQGEKIHYECDYMNDLDTLVTAGPSAQTNEMCMAIMYYFPASAGGSCF